MKFLATANRAQELRYDMRSLVRAGGEEALEDVFLAFCARKGINPIRIHPNLEQHIEHAVLGMKRYYRGQLRQSICRAINCASQ